MFNVKGTLEHLRVHFKFFYSWWFFGKLISKSYFGHWSSFQVKFERVVNRLGGQNPFKCQPKHGLIGSSAKTGNIYQGVTELGPKHKNAIWYRITPSSISYLVSICVGVFRSHKSLNRIELSQLVQDLLNFYWFRVSPFGSFFWHLTFYINHLSPLQGYFRDSITLGAFLKQILKYIYDPPNWSQISPLQDTCSLLMPKNGKTRKPVRFMKSWIHTSFSCQISWKLLNETFQKFP